jgi:hypothetical protein
MMPYPFRVLFFRTVYQSYPLDGWINREFIAIEIRELLEPI